MIPNAAQRINWLNYLQVLGGHFITIAKREEAYDFRVVVFALLCFALLSLLGITEPEIRADT